MMFSLLPVSAAAKWYEKHSVTVEYVFNDDSSKSKSADVKTTYHTEGAITPFSVKEAGYNHSAKVTSGKADCSIDDLGFLHVKHVDADSVITVTYTPKDNYIYIDKYFGNGGIFSKWDGENIKLNGYEFVENNALPKKYVIENHKLAPAMEKYRFLTVTNADNSTTVYDFSYAVVIPKTSESTERKIKDVWYDRDAGEWYYSYENKSGLFDKIPLVNEGGVNFCYNKEHTEASEHHQFDQVVKTVPATCTEKGYTVYKCAYCTKTETRKYTDPLNHDWNWVHDDTTSGADSKHQQVCQRCNKKEDPENCSFDLATTETGTHTCTVCGHSYTDEITPTGTPVYVYFRTVDSADIDIDNVEGVTYNKDATDPPHHWATLGKLETKTSVTDSVYEALGKEVAAQTGFEYYTGNNNFPLNLITWEKVSTHNGAQDYVSPGTDVWHLDGKVTAYRAIYRDSDGTELEGFTPNQTPEYYLKGATDIALTNEVPVVPGKVFDGWDTNDVTVENNTFTMPGKDVTFTAKWKPGTLVIQKVLEVNSPAAGNIFSFTVTPEGSTTGTGTRITGATSETIPDLPVGNYTVAEDANIAAVDGYRCATQYSTDKTNWQNTPITVSVASNDTVTVYVKNSYTPITADLIDNDITITHGVNAAPTDGDDTAAHIHIVKEDAKISYQATLDMSKMMFSDTPEHKETVNGIKFAMGRENKSTIWDYMQDKNITMFAGSKVNLYVKFDEKLNVTKGSFDNIKLTSDWFQLDKTHPDYLKQEAGGYWKIPCVIKAEKGTNNSPIITLSGITLPLTADAKNALSSDTALDITSGGYIDGTIKISVGPFAYTLKLEGMSKEAPAQNTAKLKLAVPTYTVTYTDGANGSAFKDQVYSGLKSGVATPAFVGTPERDGYTFRGWDPAVEATVTKNVTYTATWSQNSSHGGDDDDKYFFAIQKVDAQDGHALNGAKFELYQLDKNDRIVNRRVVETTRQSSKSGIALFSVDNKKSYDGIWYYAEVSAPEGYVLDRTEYEINHKDFSDSLSTAVKYADTVRNYRGTTPDLLNDSDHFAYVIGYMDGNVRPYGLISRAETTTIFFRLLKDSVRDGNLLTSNTYTDVADDYWANTAISTMTGLGIVQGRSTTTFDPKAPITRAQFAAICARFDTGKSNGTQTFSDIQGHWAEKYIERAAELGWIKGFEDGTFRPDTYITRAQAMTMINRVLNRIPEEESDLLPGMNVWPDCNPGDWFYLAVQEATNSHDFKHKAGNYETWTKLMKNPDWTRYEN